ncbi:MAG: 16S rRNA (cytosine(967)-C(5))-methyltransferase [Leptolyngbya sp. SIO4C1]|nr:16S rRNA (cytosine(967)-C(5))-methyltransferase [Leptolyngbya sp. SIO4C1]
MATARQAALATIKAVERGAFADVELDRQLHRSQLSSDDRRLATELVYGSVRRRRTLDALIDQLGKKPAHQQPVDLRLILQLGFYQLRYLSQIPDHAVVDTSVELAKHCRLGKLSGVVNGMLRQYIRLSAAGDPLRLPDDEIARLGVLYSYPDWIVRVWQQRLPEDEVAQLCDWFNRPPNLDLRVNRLKVSVDQAAAALQAAGVQTQRLPHLPWALRLSGKIGNIRQLPGYAEGWWMVQDASAQLVAELLNPQPGETVIDACAAPGGKTAHLAELMQDTGALLACDRTASRLKKVQQNQQRLGLTCIQTQVCDSRNQPQLTATADKVLLDVPCSGLGTLHRHADARWRQQPGSVRDLVQLQKELLAQTATWVKPGGTLVYATCTLHPDENEHQIQQFLADHPDWVIEPPELDSPAAAYSDESGWIKVWPHRDNMDGFFMVRLQVR